MKKFVIKFRGVDDFNRPVFKVVDTPKGNLKVNLQNLFLKIFLNYEK